MGIFSKLGGAFHAAGEAAGVGSVEKYGEPKRTLYTEMNLHATHQRIDIKDEQGQLLYWTKSAVIAIKGKTEIFDAAENVVANLEKKIVSLHEKHFITMADGRQFTLSNEIFHLFKDVTNIVELGWQLKGNIIGLNFTLLDQNGEPVAVIGHKMVSLHDRYSIDLYQPQQEKVVVAIVIALQKMIAARQENRSSD